MCRIFDVITTVENFLGTKQGLTLRIGKVIALPIMHTAQDHVESIVAFSRSGSRIRYSTPRKSWRFMNVFTEHNDARAPPNS